MPTRWERVSGVAAATSAVVAAVAAAAACYQAYLSAHATKSLLSYSIEKDAQELALKFKDASRNNIGPGDILAWMSSVYYQRDSLDSAVWTVMRDNFCYGLIHDGALKSFWTSASDERKNLYGHEFVKFADRGIKDGTCQP